MEFVKSPGLYTTEEKGDYFLATIMLKSILRIFIYSIATRGMYTDGMYVYLSWIRKNIYKNSLLYEGGQV